MNLITTLSENNIETATPNFVQRNWVSRALYAVSLIFRIPYALGSMIVLKTDPIGPWHLPQKKLSRNHVYAITSHIPMTYLKSIRDAHKATMTGIILTAITGAMRKVMLESEKGISQNFTVLTPLPVPGHPKKLRNHM